MPVATLNLEGRVFMKALECPFRTADRLLAELDREVKVVIVDFHAEATSEKQALGFYLEHGALPWWISGGFQTGPDELLRKAVADDA